MTIHAETHQIKSHEQILTPEQDRVIAGAATNEMKGLLLCAVRPGESYTQGELHSRLQEISDGTVDLGNRTIQMEHATSSLIPRGLMEVVPGADGAKRVALTLTGEQGKTLVNSLLWYSDKTNIPLSWVFGQNNGGAGQPSKAARHLEVVAAIAGHGELSNRAVSQLTGMPAGTTSHIIKRLAAVELVTYRPWSKNLDTPHYEAGRLDNWHALSPLSQQLKEYLGRQEVANLDIIEEKMRQLGFNDADYSQGLRQKIAAMLNEAVERGHVEKASRTKENAATLTSEQYQFWQGLHDHIQHPEQITETFIASPERVGQAIERSRLASANAVHIAKSPAMKLILDKVALASAGISAADTQRRISADAGRPVSLGMTKSSLEDLRRREAVAAADIGRTTVYKRQ